MITENREIEKITFETLDTYINRNEEYTISNKALFTGFQHRSKVEFLRFFIV